MRNVMILTRRELSSYFVSPIAYVAMALFLLISGIVFAGWDFQSGGPATMRTVSGIWTIILALILAILPMRSLSEEIRSGTIETLLTAPVTDAEVVLGKWLGCWLVYLVILAPTLLYVVLLRVYGHPDLGPILSNYLGLALVGAMYVSVGILASAMTRNQVIAAVLGIVILLIFALLGPAIASVLPTPWRTVMQQASVQSHYQDFTVGVIDLVHVIYFVVLTAYMLFFTVKILESRRWR